ncbi:hypothetical protein RB195_017841 [Necator americanus]|uniref:Hydrolase, TatD family n=1 Tax=Necator americanus TaxID=51031 RepID=A0ABR1C9G1_NECAM
MRKLEWDDMEVKVGGRQLHHLRFADVIVLITPRISQEERMLTEFDETCGCIGLQLNLGKTMFMRNGWVSDSPFTLNGTNISECTSYVYLGEFGSESLVTVVARPKPNTPHKTRDASDLKAESERLKKAPVVLIDAMTMLYSMSEKKNKSVKISDIDGVQAFLEEHRGVVKCIGEIGLDFTQHYKITPDDILVQKEVLLKHIGWAKQFRLPMTVHSRSATGDTVDFLIENAADRVALHAFNGTLEEALRGLQAGFFFSIPPSFTTGDHKRFLLEAVPIEQLLLETDSPVLGPVRGERNEPANLKLSADFIAEVKNLPVEEVISATTANARKLLGI